MKPTPLELLSPARNYEYGKAAIDHGADAVYMGAPKFGARQAAGNSLDDIQKLVEYAHLFGAKVYVTLNTLLFDNELAEAEETIWQLYKIGVDALIIQDLGLLELNLPPIPLHASTQTHNTTPEKVLFFEKQGFERVILARELSLEQMGEISQQTNIELEAFIHGALCVCYSGQCYMSHHITNRSGNRGECSQPCRSTYDLQNSKGILAKNLHLLSLKDFNASQHIESMCFAGITSFKIEGRLKDLAYLKNTTAHYRQLLDNVIANNPKKFSKASSGQVTLFFEPDIERTFNRGYSSYFLAKREADIASFSTQKSIGKKLGIVEAIFNNYFVLNSDSKIHNGDGFCFFDGRQWQGFLVNGVDGKHIYPNQLPQELKKGVILHRNNDIDFEKSLAKQSAERKIKLSLILKEIKQGFSLTATDEEGFSAEEQTVCEKQAALDIEKAATNIQKQLGKLGDTIFELNNIESETSNPFFIPISVLNTLRRNVVEKLQLVRLQKALNKKQRNIIVEESRLYLGQTVDYRANIVNEKAAEFYKKQGILNYEPGFELQQEKKKGRVLMTTKYCLRYEMKQCPVHFSANANFLEPLFLQNNAHCFALEFDCKNCEMKILST